MEAQVIPIQAATLSLADYKKRRAEISETYGDSAAEAGARFEQELARLFYSSGWTQEKLAEAESEITGKKTTQVSVGRTTRFGRFLDFKPNGLNSESASFKTLTEGKFRDAWIANPEGNERERFRDCAKWLCDSKSRIETQELSADIARHFSDGKRHKGTTIAKHFDVEPKAVDKAMTAMCYGRGSHGRRADKFKVGKGLTYQIFKQEQMVSSYELTEKLGPIIETLRVESRKRAESLSVLTIAHCVVQLKKLLDTWAK